MVIYINGEQKTLTFARSVSEMVKELNLPLAILLIEQNQVALLRSTWETTLLKEGDRFEVLQAVTGG